MWTGQEELSGMLAWSLLCPPSCAANSAFTSWFPWQLDRCTLVCSCFANPDWELGNAQGVGSIRLSAPRRVWRLQILPVFQPSLSDPRKMYTWHCGTHCGVITAQVGRLRWRVRRGPNHCSRTGRNKALSNGGTWTDEGSCEQDWKSF